MTWEFGDDRDVLHNLATRTSALPFGSVDQHVELEHQQQQQQYHRWDIRDRVLPQIEGASLDSYDHWPNGSCRRAYDGLLSGEASHHASGWAMRNTNNHNAAILKKSCLGILVCARQCVDVKRKPSAAEVRLRPAICDKARRKQIGAQCPTAGCTGTLELRRCRGHAGYPVTHFWRTQGNTIFFQAKGFHDHPVPECWKTPLSKDKRSMKPKRKCRKRRAMTSFVHTSDSVDDAQAQDDEPLNKRVKVEPTSPVVQLKSTEDCIQATTRHDLITSSTQWAEFSAWSRTANDRITVVNNYDDQQLFDTGSSPWQRPQWERVSKSDITSPAVETPVNYVSDCFRRAALQQHPQTTYYPACAGESTDCCDHRSAACRRRLFHFASAGDVLQSYNNDGITFAPMRQQNCGQHMQLFPSPPPSTSTDSFTASPPETRFGDDDFLQHLRACADSDSELVGAEGAHPARFSEMSNVDSSCFGQRRPTMTSEFYDRHTLWNSDVSDYPMTMENFVTNNGVNDDIDDVLSVMADIVMGGSSLMPNYVF